jgi:hypothetical protein
VIHEGCHLGFLSPPWEGNASDLSVAEMTGDTLPLGRWVDHDTGFPGFVLPGGTSVHPKTKPRGGELTPPEQAANRQSSSIRMRIAQAMGGVKRYRLVKDTIRLVKDGLRDAVRETCGGLHNFRLLYRPWNYAH